MTNAMYLSATTLRDRAGNLYTNTPSNREFLTLWRAFWRRDLPRTWSDGFDTWILAADQREAARSALRRLRAWYPG
jgi:hypothetical protein